MKNQSSVLFYQLSQSAERFVGIGSLKKTQPRDISNLRAKLPDASYSPCQRHAHSSNLVNDVAPETTVINSSAYGTRRFNAAFPRALQ